MTGYLKAYFKKDVFVHFVAEAPSIFISPVPRLFWVCLAWRPRQQNPALPVCRAEGGGANADTWDGKRSLLPAGRHGCPSSPSHRGYGCSVGSPLLSKWFLTPTSSQDH